MDSHRDGFHAFLAEKGLKGLLNVTGVQTQENDPKLKYNRIEKFRFSLLSWQELQDIITYCKDNGIEVYLAFGQLVVGYPDLARNTRLEVF